MNENRFLDAPPNAVATQLLSEAPHAISHAGLSQQSAVALAYSQGDSAPRVIAKGRGLIAQAILERARAHGIYVHESKALVSLLMQVDIDQRIPPELYRAVAELLVWVYRLEGKPEHSEADKAGQPNQLNHKLLP